MIRKTICMNEKSRTDRRQKYGRAEKSRKARFSARLIFLPSFPSGWFDAAGFRAARFSLLERFGNQGLLTAAFGK